MMWTTTAPIATVSIPVRNVISLAIAKISTVRMCFAASTPGVGLMASQQSFQQLRLIDLTVVGKDDSTTGRDQNGVRLRALPCRIECRDQGIGIGIGK